MSVAEAAKVGGVGILGLATVAGALTSAPRIVLTLSSGFNQLFFGDSGPVSLHQAFAQEGPLTAAIVVVTALSAYGCDRLSRLEV